MPAQYSSSSIRSPIAAELALGIDASCMHRVIYMIIQRIFLGIMQLFWQEGCIALGIVPCGRAEGYLILFMGK